ncbi:MAG: methyltransferase domain-containing protein [Promethearchaeota archaeon]|nr:MAG: methyltransferase domain-containing protein [Candidatus Lokiarchaeota archaeon]
MSRSKSESNIDFKMMAFFFKIRDFFRNPLEKVSKMNIKEGDNILEYGCGSGSFTIPLAKLVGSSGRIYAADIHPLSSVKVREKAKKNNISNIETIQTDCNTKLKEKTVDEVILIDVLHDLDMYKQNLKEFHRVLKEKGNLWVDDHHYEPEEIKKKIQETNYFKFVKSVDSLHLFTKTTLS